MGVTIHFQGTLRSPEDYPTLLSEVSNWASLNKWPMTPVDASERRLVRVIDEREVVYNGAVRGIEVLPAVNSEPLRFEFDRDNFVQEFCKTQFAGAATHIEVVKLLRTLAPLFEWLEVIDEGQYWETDDAAVLQGNLDEVETMIKDRLRAIPNARGPVRAEGGRILDIIADGHETKRPSLDWRRFFGLARR